MKKCESCGMPMEEKLTSIFDDRYCIYCQDQMTQKLKTYEEVRQGCIDATIKLMKKTEQEATKMADTMLPTLPRWKK